MDELEQLKINAGISTAENPLFIQLPNAEYRGRAGGPTMEDRVPPKEWPNMVTGEWPDKDVIKEHGDAQEQYLMKSNMEKISKTIIGTAGAMDKQDRPGVDNPSKSNVSVYINFILEQVIDDLEMQGYEVNWQEKDWD